MDVKRKLRKSAHRYPSTFSIRWQNAIKFYLFTFHEIQGNQNHIRLSYRYCILVYIDSSPYIIQEMCTFNTCVAFTCVRIRSFWGNKDCNSHRDTEQPFNITKTAAERQRILFLIIPWFPVIPYAHFKMSSRNASQKLCFLRPCRTYIPEINWKNVYYS